MRLLVTGGAGFIGTNFVLWVLREAPHASVTVLDSFTSAVITENFSYLSQESREDPVWSRLAVVRGDVRDRDTVFPLVEDHDVVVHLAAESHNDWSLTRPTEFVDTNVMGTAIVLEAVRKYGRRLHHVSTDEVFGDLPLDGGVFDRESPYRPSSPYSASKAAADHLVRAWVRSFAVAATVSISSNNYGPFQHVEKFIPRQVTELLSGRPARLYGSGVHVRDWIHVEDHCRALWSIITDGQVGQTYLVGGRNERSNTEVASDLLRVMGRDAADVVHVADRHGHDVRYALDPTATEHELGWEARIGFEQGLADTVRWYQNNERWWGQAKEATERRYRERGQ
ncbi:dTDP-glucose 4,6-dehydratase [Jonesia quinghaiensis]|uniref:dTDP-glucose 4,6-dehydratase n=1 Tax=Jonesia quinghaiensis TaxID=262806 RepID=UPI000415C170|nr:dTDP-glucose 4,6-dehydratase [Jonesia quinghaiensis]